MSKNQLLINICAINFDNKILLILLMSLDMEETLNKEPIKLSVHEVLKNRFPDSQYCLMKEVSDAAGFNRSRSADFIAVGLWPSRGLEINGIELKSFRNDWLNELKNHQKAENIFQYCDRFWLLTTDESIAKIEEIPITWGWMNIKNNKIFMKKEAPTLTPKTISKDFLAAMLKRAGNKDGYVLTSSIQDKIDSAIKCEKDSKGYQFQKMEKELNRLSSIVDQFEKASGIQIDSWMSDNKVKQIGEAVNFILSGGTESIKKELESLKNRAQRMNENIQKSLEQLQ